MFYIVYREKFQTYGINQEGYFVKYRSKLSDEYSHNWFEAYKYKSIGAAITRLGINIDKGISSFEKFLEVNRMTSMFERDQKISDIIGSKQIITGDIFKKGRVDKIGDDGQFLGCANDDVIKFINDIIEKNNKRKKDPKSIYYKTPNIVEEGDFWDWINLEK